MKGHLQLYYSENGYRILLDNNDISNMLERVEMIAEPSTPPRYILTLSAIDITEIGSEAQVHIELPRTLPDPALDEIINRCEQMKESNRIDRKAKELEEGRHE